jgi:hypothetical protein
VFLMVNLLMPMLSVGVKRWLTGPMTGNRANAREDAVGEPKRVASRVAK